MKEYNDKIDVIIPAYNVPDKILSRCLASIAMQECVDDIEVTIVDDASTEQNYATVVGIFKPLMKINLLRYEENKGPGVARQFGLDHTENGLIMFVDADDTLANSFAVSTLRREIEGDNIAISSGYFVEEYMLPNGIHEFHTVNENDVWLFGKMYKRFFLDKYQVRFHDTSRSNEDSGFNKIYNMCSKDYLSIFIPDTIYCWHYNNNSITRQNNESYTHGTLKTDSLYGYLENMEYAIKYAEERGINVYKKVKIEEFILDCLLFSYVCYVSACAKSVENTDVLIDYCSSFYRNNYMHYEDIISEELFNEKYYLFMQNKYYTTVGMRDFVPKITFFEFVKMLKERSYEND